MKTELLKEIGLTDGEIRIYLALLSLGLSATGKIIDKSHITSSKVYLILERLEQKGFVSHVMKNKVKHFQATDPSKILVYLEKKKEKMYAKTNEIKKYLIPDLVKIYGTTIEKKETTIYQGYKGIESALFDFISEMKKNEEYVVLGTGEPLKKEFELLIRRFYMKKSERGIKTRLLYNSKFGEIKKLYKGLGKNQIRFVDKVTPSTIAVSKNKILILTYGPGPLGVLIQSEQIAKSFYVFFESLWKIAKP